MTGLDPRLDEVIAYLEEREEDAAEAQEQERIAQLQAFAEEHPEILEEDVLADVTEIVGEYAERAGDESLLLDPVVVEKAFTAVMSERPVDYADQARAEMRAAGGDPTDPDYAGSGSGSYEEHGVPVYEDPEPTYEEQVADVIEERGLDPDDLGDRTRAELALEGDDPMRPD